MAKLMQQALLTVDETNTRQEKANDTYYLLKRTQVPTIIVECGFLSNPEEASREKIIDTPRIATELTRSGMLPIT